MTRLTRWLACIASQKRRGGGEGVVDYGLDVLDCRFHAKPCHDWVQYGGLQDEGVIP